MKFGMLKSTIVALGLAISGCSEDTIEVVDGGTTGGSGGSAGSDDSDAGADDTDGGAGTGGVVSSDW